MKARRHYFGDPSKPTKDLHFDISIAYKEGRPVAFIKDRVGGGNPVVVDSDVVVEFLYKVDPNVDLSMNDPSDLGDTITDLDEATQALAQALGWGDFRDCSPAQQEQMAELAKEVGLDHLGNPPVRPELFAPPSDDLGRGDDATC